jgi:hypothetical protein
VRYRVYVGRDLIWDAPVSFQSNLLKYLTRERSDVCRCKFGCWGKPLRDQDCGCAGCAKVARKREVAR